MRSLLVVMLLAVCGCTHLRLQSHTLNQGSTLSDIQYQQVLDNLAMFACDSNALAWHVKVIGGVVQVADQGNASIVPSGVRIPYLAPNLAVTRNVLGQWNVDTVVESDDLETLHLAYQKAIHPADPDRKLKKQIFEKICELTATYHIVLAQAVAAEMIETLKIDAPAEEVKKLDNIAARLLDLYHRIDTLLASDGIEAVASDKERQQPQAELASVKREIVKLTSSLCNEPFIDGYTLERTPHSAKVIEQAEDKMKALYSLVTEQASEPNQFATPWVSWGPKNCVPPCACYVAHYRGCQGELYLWVEPQHAKVFRDFVLVILSLVPPDVQEMSMPKLGVGAAFSPNF
jgi:hypothetical protein